MRRATFTVLTVVSWLAAGTGSPAEACSCSTTGPPCQAFWSDYAVFDGTVVAIEEIWRQELIRDYLIEGPQKLVTLEVHRAWKGASEGRLQVTTRMDSAACGFDFVVGKRYLVFGHPRAGDLIFVSRCSPTRAFDGTGETAEYFASLDRPPAGGWIFGTVQQHVRVPETRDVPVETTVRLAGGGRIVTQRAIGGRFKFTGLGAGGYEIAAKAPDGYESYPLTVQVETPRTCVPVDIRIVDTGRITGRAIDSSGRGVPDLQVDLALENRAPRSLLPGTDIVRSDEYGYFEFKRVAPGRYIVGLNLSDEPTEYRPYARFVYSATGSEPQMLDLSLGESRDIGPWQVPAPLAMVPLIGRVVWRDGTAAGGVGVELRDVTNGSKRGERQYGLTDAHGRFDSRVFTTRTYTVHVFIDGTRKRHYLAAPTTVVAAAGLQPLSIVVARPR